MGKVVYMTIVEHSVSAVAVVGAAASAPREAVPTEVYDGIDFESLNRRVAEYRSISREGGFDAALSDYASEPVVVRVEQS